MLSDGFAPRPVRTDRSARFGIEGNVFKFHAACYYTHSSIEAALALVREEAIDPDDISLVEIGLDPGLHSVCDIVEPATGAEVKFSIRHLVAMAFLGRPTADHTAYTVALAQDQKVIDCLRERITVLPRDTGNRMEIELSVQCASGARHCKVLDVSTPADDLDAQEQALLTKFFSLAEPVLGDQTQSIADRILAMDADSPITGLLNDLTTEPR